MRDYGPDELDILARAYDRALDALPEHATLDLETARAMLLQGILDAAQSGELDDKALAIAALNRMGVGHISGVVRTATDRRISMGL